MSKEHNPAKSPAAVSSAADMPSGEFFQRIAKRKRNERDAVILITADDADRGVGKTSLAVTLAKLLDTSPTPFDAEEQATLQVPRFLQLYDELPKGSTLVLDEGEQIDARRSMSQENVDASLKMQTRRVNQIIVIITLPSADMIDNRIEQLTDFWVNCEARGRARVYKKKIHRIKQSVYYKGLQQIQWPNMDGDPDYEALARMKDEFNNGDGQENGYIREDEVTERLEKARKGARQEARDELLRQVCGHDEIQQKHVAEAVGLTPGRVSQIAKGD
jgi:plasmid maintenance system antidote protein VapI